MSRESSDRSSDDVSGRSSDDGLGRCFDNWLGSWVVGDEVAGSGLGEDWLVTAATLSKSTFAMRASSGQKSRSAIDNSCSGSV